MNNYNNIILLERYMDLSDLRIFSAVVREGGVTRAAERLHRVQSNVTTRIRKLEEEPVLVVAADDPTITQGRNFSLK